MVLSDFNNGKLGWKKWFITGWAFFECLLFSGMLYGWGSLNYVLKMEGIYGHLCVDEITGGLMNNKKASSNFTIPSIAGVRDTHSPSDETGVANGSMKQCKAQDSKMALCYTIAAFMFGIGNAVFGFVNYRFGTRVARLIAFATFTSGALIMAFVSVENPWLIFPGFSMISTGGLTILSTNMQVTYLFNTGSGSIAGLLHGGFGTSSVVMLVVKIANDYGIARKTSFISIAVLHCSVLISTFLFLPKYFIVRDKDTDKSSTEDPHNNNNIIRKNAEESRVIPNLKSCLLNPSFLSHLVWFTTLNLRFQYFIGTLNQYLGRVLEVANEVSYYTNVCYYIMLCGFILSFLSGVVFDWRKRKYEDGKSSLYRDLMPAVLPVLVTSVLASTLSVLILIPVKELMYTIFIVMTFYRSFLFGSTAAFLRNMFPSKHFGFLYGVVRLTGAIFSTFQYALFAWTEAYNEGPFHSDMFLLCLSILTVTHPIYWWIMCLRSEKRLETAPSTVEFTKY